MELGFDSFVENEGAKSLPFFGSLYKLYRTGVGIRESIYLKKVAKFLLEISTLSETEREGFIDELEKNSQKRKFQEAVLVILERLDDMEKPAIMGRLSKALIQKQIDFATWQRLCHSVDRTFITDLKTLPSYYKNGTTSDEVGEILVANGLMNTSSSVSEPNLGDTLTVDWNGNPITYVKNRYALNTYGKLLVDIGLKE